MAIPKPHLHYTTKTENGHFEVTLTSKVFVKYVILEYHRDTGIFSDNYFSLLPGQSKTIRINLKNAEKVFHRQIKILAMC